MTQAEVLQEMLENTHSLFNQDFVGEVNAAFNTDIKCHRYKADGDVNPKGLTLDNGATSAIGLACFDLAEELCDTLKLEYTQTMGRGFQVMVCVEALKNAGYGKMETD